MKARHLIFHTDHTAEFVDGEVADGSMSNQDKEFIMDKAKPILIKKRGLFGRFFAGHYPLYMLKWNILLPAQMEVREKIGKLDELLDGIESPKMKKKMEKMMKNDETFKQYKDQKFIFRELVPMPVAFPKPDVGEGKSLITPEMLQSTHDMRFLRNFKKYAGAGGGMNKKRIFDFLFIGGMIFAVLIALSMTGVLK